MRTHPDPKAMARALRAALEKRQVVISHSAALDIVAAQHGLADWNVLAAIGADSGADGGVQFGATCPILRIIDEASAKSFYIDFLGFQLDWEHRFGDNFPLYAQVSRAGLILHLSGHHGDGSPGSMVFVRMHGINAYQQELVRKDYKHMKPGIESMPWGLVMTVIDPFGNQIRFCEDTPKD